ncbi:hypothetical protein HMPREF9587_00064 [Cutibacterium acnes HL025PA1]|nr:hypothetical protein HMPREF9587_00064 [Cutibacterium acnes HL025PA1]
MKELFDKLQNHGRVLIIVDQPNTIGGFLIAAARSTSIAVAYLLCLAMCRVAGLYLGTRRPIRGMRSSSLTPPPPHAASTLARKSSQMKALVGFDEDLTAKAASTSARMSTDCLSGYSRAMAAFAIRASNSEESV